MPISPLTLKNGQSFSLSDVPSLSIKAFRTWICASTTANPPADMRLMALWCVPEKDPSTLYALLGDETNQTLHVSSCPVGQEYPALTPQCMQAHLFEREIFEQLGIRPLNHPWLKPVRFPLGSHHPSHTIGEMDFFQIKGEEIHEVGVGPVHAGVIEPGHFRFQCKGEVVKHLEISLGYQHRGIEQTLCTAPPSLQRHLVEAASGDSTVGHTWAYCQALEGLAGCDIPPRAQAIRGIGLELERLACHIGDMGAISGDIGFLPTSSFCGRIRGDVLNMTATICGNRFSRGLLRPGGVAHDIDPEMAKDLMNRLDRAWQETDGALRLFWDTPSVLGRLEHTGKISPETAMDLGLVGPVARACGLKQDVRHNFPTGPYESHSISPVVGTLGGVFDRAKIRTKEINHSVAFIREMLTQLPDSPILAPLPEVPENQMTISLIEGWRGEICHIAQTGSQGKLIHYKIIDPSFHNWFGVAQSLRDEGISDFPLCNKSFNLSYCGFDL